MSRASKAPEELAIGDYVVYASYGVGQVTRRTPPKRADTGAETVVLEFVGGLSVTLPIERARGCLRPLADETELKGVQKTLRATTATIDPSWRVRLKATQEKVSAGVPVGLAEVVRDGVHRGPKLTAGGGLRELSLAERHLYLKARQLLADEIAGSRGVETAEADDWISAQLGETPAGQPV